MARFSPDGNVLAVARGSMVNLRDATTGEAKASLSGHERDVSSIAFSPDGRRVATGSADGTVKIWNAATGRETSSMLVHRPGRPPRYRIVSRALFVPVGVYVSFSPNGNSVLAHTFNQSQTAKLFDALTGQLQAGLGGHTQDVGAFVTRTEPVNIWRAAFSPDGRYVVTESIDTVKLWEAATGRLKETLGLVSASAAFSPDGRWLALVKKRGIVGLLNIETGSIEAVGVNTSFLNQTVFSSDSRTLVVGSGYKDYRMTFVEVQTGQVKANAPLVSEWGFDFVSDYQKNVDLLSFHPNSRIVLGANHRSLKFWDAATGRPVTETNEGRDPAAFSSDGRMLVAVGQDKKAVLLWEATSN